MLSRDEYRKIVAKLAYKDERRAGRLMKQGKDLEAAFVLNHSIITQGLLNYAYLKAEKEYKKEQAG